jgi:23S rRNA (adenine2030-N6)-methyltransferase
MKHALWLRLLDRLTSEPRPLQVIDTHAGAGLYDLEDHMARRSREAEAGIGRLMADAQAPPVFAPLKAAVLAENPLGGLRFYPGSPLSTAKALRGGDRYTGYELRPDDQEAAQALLDRRGERTRAAAAVIQADGYAQLSAVGADRGANLACLIDPPYERGDEYDQIVASVAAVLNARPRAVLAIWAPLKDLETFDALLRRIEALRPPSLLVAEVRLRPLLDPMRMNGCAMIFIDAPGLEADADAVCGWTAKTCGEAGAAAQVRRLSAAK